MSKKSSDALYKEQGDDARIIPRSVITRYAKVCALHNRLGHLRTAMREEMLKSMKEGFEPARDGPFVLALESQNRIDNDFWSWKMFALELAVALEGGDVMLGMMKIKQAEEQAPRKDVPVLKAKPAPSIEWKKVSGWIERGLNEEGTDPHS
jgi:hypothetical protein